jgi:DNA-binding transcriptional LysR family regulator
MPNEPTRSVWLTVHKDLRKSPAIRAMLDFLTEMFRADADLLRYGLRKG